MRVAYVCADPGVPVFGRKGCSIHVQEMIRALQAHGAEVELFATNSGDEASADLREVMLHLLPPIPKGELESRERAALAANQDLREVLERRGPFDLVYERYSLWSHAALEYARRAGTPSILEVNAPLIEEQAKYRGLLDRKTAMQVAEWAFGSATVLIVVSQKIAEYLECFPAARGRVHVVANGVNPDRFNNPSPRGPGVFTVGFIGTLKPWHGLTDLVDAFAMLHDWHPESRLLVVGDGPERESLLADLAARGLTAAAELTGAISPNEVPGLLAKMDVAVAPYPEQADFYFSPLKVYEYMAAGLAVVATRCGQITEILEDGVNGLLCPPGDPGSLARALDQLQRDPELRRRLGAAARADALREHTWSRVAARVLHLAGLTTSERAGSAEVVR